VAYDALDSDVDPATGRTITTTSVAGETDDSWDAGFYEVATIGDLVWEDLNADGVQDAGEPGIPGVTVELSGTDGLSNTVLLTTTTDATGVYSFTNLVPGDYQLTFSTPIGYSPTGQNQAGDTVDSDADTSTGRTITTTLSAGETDNSWDAGFYRVATLGDTVWEDTNADGDQDVGEPGISGVTVELSGTDGLSNSVLLTTTTDATGVYSFTNLVPGDYQLTFSTPAGYEPTGQNQAGDTVDSDADTSTGQTAVTDLESGETDNSWDAGFYRPASIGDYVWEDTNGNGIQDETGTGIPGVTVELSGTDGLGNSVSDSTTTDATGVYSFTDLVPGVYQLTFNTPAGYTFTGQDAGGNDALDSDADPATGATGITVLVAAENDDSWDAGFYRPATIGNYVWNDADADGVQDAGESGIANVTIILSGTTSLGATISDSTVTAGDGSYSFTNLAPGDYQLTFSTPTGFTPSEPDQGGNDALDSDADTSTGQTTVTGLESGETDDSWDAGFYQGATIGDTVWEDTNGNGIQDAGEPGIANVVVELAGTTSLGSSVTLSTTTGVSGTYSFSGLVPGNYQLTFNPPASYSITARNQGSATEDSDADPTTGQTSSTLLTSGENDLTWDAGLYRPASIGNRVWEDTNANGIQDAGEPGIDSVGVTLTGSDGAGNPVNATTTTDSTGIYTFTNLAPGDYSLTFSTPSGYVATGQDASGSTDANDSDADVGTGQTSSTTLVAAENDDSWDAGFYRLANLGDFVWDDLDFDGIQEAGEPGVSGITVTLYDDGDNLINSTTTAGDGSYSFTNLIPGTYYVVFSNLPADSFFTRHNAGTDDTLDSDVNRTTGASDSVTLVSGEDNNDLDGGISTIASLGDTVWEDTNGNGIQDAGELGIAGVTVTLYDSGTNNPVGTPQVTDADGFYAFTNVDPGSYYLIFSDLPSGYEFTLRDQGSDDTADSDPDPTSGQTAAFDMQSNQNDPTHDAGLVQRAALGDTVWNDINGNGIQDTGETGINGIRVELYQPGADGLAGTADDIFVADTITANDGSNDGRYRFDSLLPGTYFVTFSDLPSGYIFSGADQGSDDTLDSDADPANGRSTVFTLNSGSDDLSRDAGIYLPASIGDTIWEDLDLDGIQESGENGLDGITVELRQGGSVISTTVTGGGGVYRFENLPAGDYQIRVQTPAGYRVSPQQQGTDDTIDSNIDPSTRLSDIFTLTPGENNTSIDAGIVGLASVGNRVWLDDGDGIYEAGEPGISGVTVRLYRADGTLVDTALTDSNGEFVFDRLEPGDYYLEFVVPNGLVISPQDQGSNDGIDSDANTGSGRTNIFTLNAGDNDMTWWVGLSRPPTAITLTRFEATGQATGVRVVWSTGMELNTQGFHIYRSNSNNVAAATRLTDQPISARGSGSVYEFTDPSGVDPVFYWLEEVEYSGTTTLHGPVQPVVPQVEGTRQIYLPLIVR
jgi:protocatechuate 3,4-dioxygenase beta subunit